MNAFVVLRKISMWSLVTKNVLLANKQIPGRSDGLGGITRSWLSYR
jgi:hypothetical protein